ncbi:MAG: hypothetical protein ACD_39C01773G0001 [uncultured bacterium]|nr:MAG: hypothetical protein ACD_39C01773G0001 [uncultured bacterium]
MPWQDDFLLATVDKVDWELVQKEQGCASFNAESDKFKTQVDFNRRGAATALATITVRLIGAEKAFYRHNPQFKNRYEEPVFELPSTRADLWAITAGPIKNITGRFPQNAIAEAYRTYELASFTFELACIDKKEYAFNKDTGLQTVSLETALGVDTIETSNVSFQWKAEPASSFIHQAQELPTRFVIRPSEPCTYTVNLEAFLNFPGSNPITLGESKTSAEAVSLYSLIETSVEPASFPITLGETKTLKYIVSSLEQPPTNALDADSDNNIIYLLDNSYTLTIENVEWSYSQGDPPTPAKKAIEGNPYEFQANVPGYVKGQVKGFLKVSENFNTGNKARQSTVFHDNALWHTYILLPTLQILINNEPVGQQEYYLGQKIVLSYRLESGSGGSLELENQTWEISGAKVKAYNPEVLPNYPRPCNASILSAGELTKRSVDLFLYCLDDENFVKQIKINGAIKDRLFSAGATIKIEHPKLVEPIPELPPATCSYFLEPGNPYAVYYIGYKNNGGSNDIVKFDPTISNQTQIDYVIGALQLVSNNHWRELKEYNSENTPIEKEEVIITLPTNKKWLDKQFPVNDPGFCSSGQTVKIEDIYNDTPRIECDDSQPKFIQEVVAEAEFTLIIMARPAATAIAWDKTIWVPIKAFTWGWGGHAVKQLDTSWVEVDHSVVSFGFTPEKLLNIVEWEFVANKDTLYWRPKHEL